MVIASSPRWLVGMLFAVIGASLAGRQPSPLTEMARTQIVLRTADELSRGYVFPDQGLAMASLVRSKLSSGAYDSIVDSGALASQLTQDLRALSHDRHLRVAFSSSSTPASPPVSSGPTRSALDRIDRLAGNVGYLKIDVFPDEQEMRPVLEKAMRELDSTDALIIDLTTNVGGSGDGVMALLACFVPARTLVAHIYSRLDDSTTEMWTSAITGRPYLNKPLFVLTSGRTFSAGEAAAYYLKFVVHAVTVGAATGGGAHRTRPIDLGNDFTLLLPFARPISVATGTDWEGTGVVPELPSTPAQALTVAHLAALRKLPASPARHQEIRRLDKAISRGGAAGR